MDVAQQFDEIWLFVEEKFKTTIPTYIKNILKVCGYNNGITIASIEEDDLRYFENEVRNGNVSHYFNVKNVTNIYEGCTKSVQDFEFTRGHRKFLMSIAKLLKKQLEDNGPNSFILEVAAKPKLVETKRKSAGRKIAVVPRKIMKYSSVVSSTTIHLETSRSESSFQPPVGNSAVLLHESLEKERSILLSKTLMSLISHTPDLYVENYEMINTKISTDLVTVEIDKSSSESLEEPVDDDEVVRYVANFSCPFCSQLISVLQSFNQLSSGCPGKPWWNTSNIDRHLKIHQNYVDVVVEENTQNIDVLENLNVAISEEQRMIVNSNSMLQKFVNSAERNSTRKKPGYRYDIITKMFAAFIKMLAGLLAYETLQANFPLSLPSVSTVNRFLADNGPQIIEGEMRTDELVEYLKNRNLPPRISLSEDATRVTAKISYDPNTNQLIGFALPLDKYGMPMTSSFPARNVREIQNHFTNPSNFISSTAYVQMAQPVEPNSSPFCFMIFSTDNKFTAHNILRRWQYQAYKLKEKGITIENISSDGDARPLMAMKFLSEIGQQDLLYLDCEWFSCGGCVETTFTQDVVHIITKSRNRALKCSRIFPIGNKIISSSHLKYLIEHVSKDKHLLTPSDIEPKDKQNFQSAEKICSEKVIQGLLEYVPGSEATAMYLKVMRSILDAFLDTKINSKERIYLMWYAVFFCRAWRSWLLNSEKLKTPTQKRAKNYYNLKENFMSSNCYTCIELNAHALVKQVLVEETSVEDSSAETSSEFFFPNLYGSQVCESMFRQIRSFTSTFSTVVNFNMLDIIHRMRKIQLQSDIINNCNGAIRFPRFEKKAANISTDLNESHRFKSLTRTIIICEIERSKEAVTSDLKKFGIDTSKLNLHCQVKPVFEGDILEIDSDLDMDSDSEEIEFRNENHEPDLTDNEAAEEIEEDVNYLSGITGELMLKDYTPMTEESESEGSMHLDEKCPFVVVADNTGKTKVVRKSAVCYVLSKDKHKLSSDRLQRVQEKEYSVNNSERKLIPSADELIVNQEIVIGEWCIFSERYDQINRILLGLVLEFTYLQGKTFKEREFSKSSAPVQLDLNKSIGVLCDFYTFNDVGELIGAPGDKHKFIRTDTYMGTVKEPIYFNKTLKISRKLLIELNNLRENLMDL